MSSSLHFFLYLILYAKDKAEESIPDKLSLNTSNMFNHELCFIMADLPLWTRWCNFGTKPGLSVVHSLSSERSEN